MSRSTNPRYDWLLVELTLCLVVFAAGTLAMVSGCPAAAHGQQLAPVPAGQFRADVSGETNRAAQIAQQRELLRQTQYQGACNVVPQYGMPGYVRGPAGPAGPPGIVDYDRVGAMIDERLKNHATTVHVTRADLDVIVSETVNYLRADGDFIAAVATQLKSDAAFVAAAKGEPGPMGERGPAGEITSAIQEEIVRSIVARLKAKLTLGR